MEPKSAVIFDEICQKRIYFPPDLAPTFSSVRHTAWCKLLRKTLQAASSVSSKSNKGRVVLDEETPGETDWDRFPLRSDQSPHTERVAAD